MAWINMVWHSDESEKTRDKVEKEVKSIWVDYGCKTCGYFVFANTHVDHRLEALAGSSEKQYNANENFDQAYKNYEKVMNDIVGGYDKAADYERKLYRESNPIATSAAVLVNDTTYYKEPAKPFIKLPQLKRLVDEDHTNKLEHEMIEAEPTQHYANYI